MAGRRKKSGKPRQRDASPQRRQEAAATALAAAGSDPGDRVWAAANYVRSAMNENPAAVAAAADEVVKFLLDIGNRIYSEGRGAA